MVTHSVLAMRMAAMWALADAQVIGSWDPQSAIKAVIAASQIRSLVYLRYPRDLSRCYSLLLLGRTIR
jgi:transketolase C-terminal domain/subunit